MNFCETIAVVLLGCFLGWLGSNSSSRAWLWVVTLFKVILASALLLLAILLPKSPDLSMIYLSIAVFLVSCTCLYHALNEISFNENLKKQQLLEAQIEKLKAEEEYYKSHTKDNSYNSSVKKNRKQVNNTEDD